MIRLSVTPPLFLVRLVGRLIYAVRRARTALIRSRRDYMPVRPLAEVFPGARTEEILPAKTVETPLRPGMVLHDHWRSYSSGTVQLPAVGVSELRDAIFCPKRNIVLNPDRSAIAAESVGYPDIRNGRRWPPSSGDFPKRVVNLGGTYSSFRCFEYHRVYFHTVVDGMARLFPLLASRLGSEPFQLLITEPISAAEQFFLQRLLPPRVTLHFIPNDAVVRVDRYLHADYMTPPGVPYLRKEYLSWFLHRVLPDRKRIRRKRIYIARGDAGTRRILNEEELIRMLAPLGFQTYELGTMPIWEQIELFYDAEIVVSAHGSGLTNMIFSDGIDIVELFNSPFVRPHYWYLSTSVGHRHHFVYGSSLKKYDDFVVPVATVRARVEEVLHSRDVSRE